MLKIGSNISEVRIDGKLEHLRRDLDAFQEFGLTAAEIGVHGTDVIRHGKLDSGRLLAIQTILNQYPFAYSVHAPNPLNLMDEEDFDLHVDVMRSSLEFTQAIGAEIMVYHPGRFQAEESFGPLGKVVRPEDQCQRLLDLEAEIILSFASEFPDQVIAMENARPYRYHSPYCYAETISALKEQVERINRKNVAITLDFGHLHMASKFYGFEEVAAVTQIAGLIRHCHVHDNFGGSVYHTDKQQTHQIPLGKGDSHMPIGWGDIDFDELFSCFMRHYQGLLITELRGRYFESTGESATTLLGIAERAQAA
ncbi:Sugar phosphate isomerase/epimerase [Desulfuromusa kysingii]|uniref:Sugar phosphate isomerase/epimerase n=1 Tax=Desulfuromusa kysingii TaxID=37625 RepID=A0A1H3ZW95_9BACT|nr:sugar phosphate isomerase/epimerase [Desulfuromusa kysingii]SEA27959.1 Sugar phosphate isomerase/epimerase [Desulfuromusa kysingii]